MGYKPEPIDTSGIELPAEVMDLVEKLAKNAHDLWSLEKYSNKWSYGPEINEALKKHNSLVPYEELTEEQKEYDRKTAMGTLKAIIAEGFRIVKS